MDGVLVIDDELLIRKICSDILAAEGYRVLTAGDAESGLRLASAEPVAAVVLDLMMPRVDGITAIRELARVVPDAPVIVISAVPGRRHIIEALKSGAYDFLPKPFQPQDLVSAVRRALDRHRLLAENRALLSELKAKVEELSRLNAAQADFARTLEAEVERKTRDLQQTTQLTENIVAKMGSGLLVTDLEGCVTRLNPSGADTFRMAPPALEGRRLMDVFPEAGELLRVGSGTREIILHHPDGSRIPLGFNSSYLVDPEGRRAGVIVVFRDLSEIKTLQEQIRQKDRLATIGEVAAKMAHEIRNPLAGISYVAQILKREVRFEASHEELIQAMFAEINRLNGIIDDLLLYGRPARFTLAPLNLQQICEEILSLSQEQLETRELTLERDFDPRVPPVPVDGNRMRQVILNLLKNAMEATGPGGAITLRTRFAVGADAPADRPDAGPAAPASTGAGWAAAAPPGGTRWPIAPANAGAGWPTATANAGAGWVEIDVSDTGAGIPDEDTEKIFELFYTTKLSGSGLGLPICRRIVEEHGGTLALASRPGAGSTFTIRLPLSPVGAGA